MKDWRDQVVVITGGSSGLGLALARAWAREGARLILLARDAARLDQACAALQAETRLPPAGIAVDLRDSTRVDEVMKQIEAEFGGIDVLVNCAGLSTRHALETTAPQLFLEQMQANFMTAVNCTQAALPCLLRNRGLVVMIASLAGRTAWPLVGAYVTSKSALVAYAEQLRLELGERLQVLTVLPGPIRREDSQPRYQSESAGLSEKALQPGAGAPVKGLDPADLAREIVLAAARGKAVLVRPWKAGLLFKLQAFSPGLGRWLLRRLSR